MGQHRRPVENRQGGVRRSGEEARARAPPAARRPRVVSRAIRCAFAAQLSHRVHVSPQRDRPRALGFRDPADRAWCGSMRQRSYAVPFPPGIEPRGAGRGGRVREPAVAGLLFQFSSPKMFERASTGAEDDQPSISEGAARQRGLEPAGALSGGRHRPAPGTPLHLRESGSDQPGPLAQARQRRARKRLRHPDRTSSPESCWSPSSVGAGRCSRAI